MITNVELKELKDPKFVIPKEMTYEQKGVKKRWELVEVHDSVAVILVDESKGEFVIVKQFRPPVHLRDNDGFTYELCAGIIDKDKSLEQIAIEEIYEETGYDVKEVEKITSFYTSVGFGGSKQTLFFAKVDDSMRAHEGGGVESEDIEVIYLPFSKAKEFIFDESIPKTPGIMFSFYWYFATNQKEFA